MKKIPLVLVSAALLLLAACSEKKEASPAEAAAPGNTVSETVTETDISVTVLNDETSGTGSVSMLTFPTSLSETDEEETVSEETAPEETVSEEDGPDEYSCERLLMIFGNADPSTGFIGKNMKNVLKGIHEDIPIKRLTEKNISAAKETGTTGKVLFAFSINRSNGLLPITLDGKTYYASGFTSESGEPYTAVFGNSDICSPKEAARYINTCGRADYIAFCAETENGTVLIPIAAGTPEDGIYTVIPNAEMMGYDMSGVKPFSGIKNSFGIYITGTDYSEEDGVLSLYYETVSSFPADNYFLCDEIFIAGEPIPEEFANEFPITLYSRGTVRLNAPQPSEDDVFFFSGKICAGEEELCSAGISGFRPRAQSLRSHDAF